MSFKEKITSLGKNVLDLVFPITCLVCGQEGIYLCPVCASKLPRLEKQLCISCTKPSPFGKTHPDCVTRNVADGMICGLTYKHKNTDKIIRTFKYSFVSDLAEPLSKIIIQTINVEGLSNYFQEFTLIPVPLHRRRQNWRGFNQAQLLGAELAKHLNIPIDDQLILRSKFTKPQTTLSQDERKSNIQNAFSINSNVAGKKFLIVDDVVTTGSTINEISKLLKQKHASEIWALAVAHG
jgi:ComF family protein